MQELSIEQCNDVNGANSGDAAAGGFVAGALAGGGAAFGELSAAGYVGMALVGGTVGTALLLGAGMAGLAVVAYNVFQYSTAER